jgi:hypothetical protein
MVVCMDPGRSIATNQPEKVRCALQEHVYTTRTILYVVSFYVTLTLTSDLVGQQLCLCVLRVDNSLDSDEYPNNIFQ